ncbi:hypothetical protein ADUPG1_011719, partial [Aduncisulcus paluster]
MKQTIEELMKRNADQGLHSSTSSVSSASVRPVVVLAQSATPPMLKEIEDVALHEWATKLDLYMENMQTVPSLVTCTASGTDRKLQEKVRAHYAEQPGFQLNLRDPAHTRMVVTAILKQKVTVGSALETKLFKEAKRYATGSKMSGAVIETYIGQWSALRRVYSLDGVEPALKEKLLEAFTEGIQNPAMLEKVSSAMKEERKKLKPEEHISLGQALDILSECARGLDEKLAFAAGMNPHTGSRRSSSRRKEGDKESEEEDSGNQDVSELSESPIPHVNPPEQPGKYWGIKSTKGAFPPCVYCGMSNHPAPCCLRKDGGASKPFGTHNVPLTKEEISKYWAELRAMYKKAPEQMVTATKAWVRKARSDAVEPWRKKQLLMRSKNRKWRHKGNTYSLNAEQVAIAWAHG